MKAISVYARAHYVLKWLLAVVAAVTAVLWVSPGLAQSGGGFSVAPTRLEATVVGDDAARVNVYLTSDFDGELATGMEGIPFLITPESISVNRGDANRKIELAISSEPGVAEGSYSGKLTFLAGTGKNIAYGVKIDIVVRKTSEVGFVAEIFDHITAKTDGRTGRNYTVIIILAVAVVVALAVGVLIGRRFRRD